MVKTPKKPKVFVMMSGGVDSSVAAFLLKKSNKYEVLGVFIKGYNVDGCQERDAEDARRAAKFLRIPFYAVDLEKDYKKLVVDYMISGYKKGITPNPDVMCNKEIKFGLFLKKALELGADFVATGHYVKLKTKNGACYLYQAKDKNKDQSYFLWTMTQKQLKHCLFPIGDYLKPEVRKIAKRAGLPTAERKESQGICFLGQVSIKDFLKQFLPAKKGDILTVEGEKIGEHDGVWFYTIGQRHGLGIGGARHPYYVAAKNIKKNILIAAEGGQKELYKKEVNLEKVNLISLKITKGVLARVRYRQPLFGAEFLNTNKNKFKLIFKKPQKFVASGQSAVIYGKGGEILGGGIIK